MVLPGTVLHSAPFAVLAAFVAINTVMYGAMALAKLFPKVYLSDWLPQRNQRLQSRSIYPDPDPDPGAGWRDVGATGVPAQSRRTRAPAAGASGRGRRRPGESPGLRAHEPADRAAHQDGDPGR